MPRKKSAADFLAELNADPEHVARRSAQEDARVLREAEIQTVTRSLLEALAARGYPIATLDDLPARYAPLPESVVGVVLEKLLEIHDPGVQEQLVRALGAAAVPFDGAPLVRLFEATESEAVRYAVANTLAQANPRGIAEWALQAVRNAEYGAAREMLALAVARHAAPDQANPVLLGLLDELPGHAALALAESGRAREMEMLEAKHAEASGWVRKEIGRAVSVIRRRLTSQ